MKTFHAVLFFAFLGVSFAGKLTEADLSPIEKECITELGLDMQAVLDSVDDEYLTTEGDAKINEYSECSYRKSNVIDENNEINFEAVKPLFTPYVEYINNKVVDKDQASSAAVDSCKSVKGDTLGDRINKFNNCCVKYIREH